MIAPLLPGQTLGILGGGQLGRMMTAVARRMGLRVKVAAEPGTQAAQSLADETVTLSQEDPRDWERFVAGCDRVTYESENWSAELLERIAERTVLSPNVALQRAAQHRLDEKRFVASVGAPVVPYLPVTDSAELDRAGSAARFPGVLKTARFGYDGKGQEKVASAVELAAAWEKFGRVECVLEELVSIDAEFSVIGCRDTHGRIVSYGPLLNVHHRHVLDITVSHPRLPDGLADDAIEIVRAVLERLDAVGTLCIEFFVCGGKLFVNEMAPRPHNSGHLTIEGSIASQFENHVRAVAGWPLGDGTLRQPAAMVNLLGDVWTHGEPAWERLFELPDVHLHLYGKSEAKPGRKMGHVTALAESPLAAAQAAFDARRRLLSGPDDDRVRRHLDRSVLDWI